ncbi:hypothetical protein Ahy_B03g066106 isoform A [Arachis hypogaea]|uniref:Uncharacterized protein n=1 Tax=Arachis hypogaea TaxID=3818 RepID=A0A445A348_ARAHY|nr:hypothetical protein Ahy_B03g066106 isoform A [Arachis hypogaea]
MGCRYHCRLRAPLSSSSPPSSAYVSPPSLEVSSSSSSAVSVSSPMSLRSQRRLQAVYWLVEKVKMVLDGNCTFW